MTTTNSSVFQSALDSIPEEVNIQVNLSFDIADKIAEILSR